MKDCFRSAMILLCLLLLNGCGAAIYQGITSDAERYNSAARYEDNIALLEPKLSRGESMRNTELMFLCEAYSRTKRFNQLFSCLDKMEENCGKGDTTYYGFDLREGMAESRSLAFIELGDYASAASYSRKFLDANKDSMSRYGYVRTLSIHGLANALGGDAAAARAVVAELEAIYLGYPFNMIQQDRNEGEARIFLALGQYDKAYEVMQRVSLFGEFAKGVATVVIGSTDLFVVMELPTKFMRAKAAYMSGHVDEARKGYDDLLANDRSRQSGEIYWQMLHDRGRIAAAEGQPDRAAGCFSQAVEIIEQQRRSISSETAKIGFVGNKQAVYADLVATLVGQGRTAEALEYVERAKSRALVDLLAERQNLAPQAQAETVAALLQLAELERKCQGSSAARPDERTQLRSAISGIQSELRRSNAELASLVTVGALRAAEIQARLAPDETLLEYYGQGDNLYAFAVTRDAMRAVKLDGKGLEAEVRRLREAVAKVGSDSWRPLARSLHDRLVAPLPGALDKPRLVIVGHGPLHYLPWGALHDGSRFLLDRATLTLLPSASVTQFLAARKAAPARQMLLLGNPDLGDAAMDLPGAEAEARAIKGIWPDATMLMRRAAAKSALTRAGALFRVIHVAAHGEFSSDRPLDSALLLSPEGADDGRLTAGDLYSLRLSADLVTLSACETGMGKVLSGDDVIGLTRGFLYAGAGSIVASLWPVSDDETRFLMTSFYGNLKKLPKADALRQAQLETRKRYPHPFYWSAFQLTGMGK